MGGWDGEKGGGGGPVHQRRQQQHPRPVPLLLLARIQQHPREGKLVGTNLRDMPPPTTAINPAIADRLKGLLKCV